MKLPANLKLGSVLDVFKKNLSLVLLGFLLFVATLTFFVVYGEMKKISESQIDSSNAAKIVRVNLEDHKNLEKKLNDNSTFTPILVPGADAFGVAPEKTN